MAVNGALIALLQTVNRWQWWLGLKEIPEGRSTDSSAGGERYILILKSRRAQYISSMHLQAQNWSHEDVVNEKEKKNVP